jgi:hypothetical protein
VIGSRRVVARAIHRGLVLAHRGLSRAERLARHLPLALFDSRDIEVASIDEHYAEVGRYRDPENQTSGLFPYEQRALERYFPKPPARLLVPGAGGGRELLALRALGYDVEGFEPVASMVAAAKTALGPEAHRIWRENVQAWVRTQVQHEYDGILTGWTVWTHLVRQADRLDALRAFRRACPRGPVLLSFWRTEPVLDPLEATETASVSAGRIEQWTRTWLRQSLFGLPPLEPGTGWDAGMWVHYANEGELEREGERTGYELAHYERDGSRFPNAVLVPSRPPGKEG